MFLKNKGTIDKEVMVKVEKYLDRVVEYQTENVVLEDDVMRLLPESL